MALSLHRTAPLPCRHLVATLLGGLLLLSVAGCASSSGPPSGAEPQTLSWQFARASGNAVDVLVDHGVCDDGPRATVTETPTTVRIDVRTNVRRDACAAVAVRTPLTVQLTTPLGDRLLSGCGSGSTACRP